MKKVLAVVFVIILLIVVFGLGNFMGGNGFGFGNGLGNGSGNGNGNSAEVGDGSGNSDDNFVTENSTKNQVLEDNLVEPEEPVATATPMPVEYHVIIEKDKIIFNNETVSNAQSLASMIVGMSNNEEQIHVIIHDEVAFANTVEDVKNALNKSDIPWSTVE